MTDYLNPSRIYTDGLKEAGVSIFESTTTGKEYLQVATFKGFLTVRPDAPNCGTESSQSTDNTNKKCGNPQLFSEAERLIGEINGRLDEIEKCTQNANDDD